VADLAPLATHPRGPSLPLSCSYDHTQGQEWAPEDIIDHLDTSDDYDSCEDPIGGVFEDGMLPESWIKQREALESSESDSEVSVESVPDEEKNKKTKASATRVAPRRHRKGSTAEANENEDFDEFEKYDEESKAEGEGEHRPVQPAERLLGKGFDHLAEEMGAPGGLDEIVSTPMPDYEGLWNLGKIKKEIERRGESSKNTQGVKNRKKESIKKLVKLWRRDQRELRRVYERIHFSDTLNSFCFTADDTTDQGRIPNHKIIGTKDARTEFLASLRRRKPSVACRSGKDAEEGRNMSRGRQVHSRLGRRHFIDTCAESKVLALPLVSSHRSANGKDLNLAHYGIGNKLAYSLAESLKDNQIPIVKADLRGNHLADEGARPLLKALMACPDLLQLDLSDNSMSRPGAALTQLFYSRAADKDGLVQDLLEVNLTNNRLHTSAVVPLMKAVVSSISLQVAQHS